MYTISKDGINKIKELVKSFDESMLKDVDSLYENYEINLFVKTETKEIHNILFNNVLELIKEDKVKKLLFNQIPQSESMNYIIEVNKYVKNIIITEHLEAVEIINRIHPIILNRLSQYGEIIYNEFQGNNDIKTLYELINMYNSDEKTFNNYLDVRLWGTKQENYNEVQELLKSYEVIKKLYSKYNIPLHTITNHLNFSEHKINNLIQNFK